MEAVNSRLKFLEDVETRLYREKETTTQKRAREDEQLQYRRQEEDREFFEALGKRDQEEDELRRKRRLLSRYSFGIPKLDNGKCQAATDFDNGPVTRSKKKVKRSVKTGLPSSNSGKRDYGPPTARDSQGRDLFTRPSDGKLVYLRCCVAGCGRSQFPNARALRDHVCSPSGLHKIKGLLMTNSQAIEVCGQAFSDDEELLVATKDQPSSTAHIANVTRVGVLPSSSSNTDEYCLQNNTSARSLFDAETRSRAMLSKALEPLKAQNLGRGRRMRRSRDGSQTDSRMRSEEAIDAFNGFTSSDSEDSNESEAEPLEIPAGRVDQHRAAKRNTKTTATSAASVGNKAKTTEDHSALVTSPLVSAVDDSSIKRERSASPSPLLELLEHHPSPKTFVVALEAEQVPSSGTNANHLIPILGTESIATTRKGIGPGSPVIDPTTTRDSECLIRSSNGLAMRQGE